LLTNAGCEQHGSGAGVAAQYRFSLQRVDPPPLPEKITAEDLGVVCWMVVLPAD
jgi:hypothetical protein